MHAGIDIATGRRDEPVYAIKGGTVSLVAPNTPTSNMRGYGNLVFSRRGGFDVRAGSAADRGRTLWAETAGAALTRAAVSGLGQQYEPPVFERDVAFGLTPIEWAAIGTGALVVGATAIGLFIRSRRMTSNRRGGPRKNRLRRWGEK